MIDANSCPKFDESVISIPFNNYYILYSTENNKVSVLGEYSYKILKNCDGNKKVKLIAQEYNSSEKDILRVLNKNLDYLAIFKKYSPRKKHLDCWFSITNDCNLCCPYCYIDKNTNSFTLEKAIQIIDSLLLSCRKRNIDELRIRFAGGEPLLCFEEIKQCFSYAEKVRGKINVLYSVITNGTLITDYMCEWFLSNNIRINISMDGINEYHNMSRMYKDGSDSYDDVYKAICMLTSYGIPISVLTTITLKNMNNLVELSRKLLEIKKIHIHFSFEKSLYNHQANLVFEQKKLEKILNECLDLFERELRNGNTDFDFSLGRIRFSNKRYRACGAGINTCALNCDNIVAECGMGLSKGTLINEEDFYSILNEKTNNLTVLDREKCSDCVWRFACAGGCKIDNYNYWGADNLYSPYCDVISALMPRLIKLYGEKIYYLSIKEGIIDAN